MQSKATTVEQYLNELPEDRIEAMVKLRNIINANIPEGFQETMSYGMIGWVVPHSIYPAGYHCTPQLPLPFLNIASQKNFISVYHMGIYSSKGHYEWFTTSYANQSKIKLDIGKSCMRFKKPEHIPYDLIGELVSKISVQEWIQYYEKMKQK